MDQFYAEYKEKLCENYPGLTKFNFQDFIGRYQKQNRVNIRYSDNCMTQLKECLLAGIPLSYLLKSHYFYNHEMYVDKSVLIPRFETEFLVSEGLAFIQAFSGEKVRVADICTGSGCIVNALQIESEKTLTGIATDIDSKALAVAEYNNFLTGYLKKKSHEIKFALGDRLGPVLNQRFDLILANPPYIKRSQKVTTVHKNVHTYEPHIALYLEDDQYREWFEVFFNQVNRCLAGSGLFIMEGDSEHLLELLAELKESSLLAGQIELKEDLAGRTRYLIFKKG